jgi:zinc and cadmium transporter
MWPVILIAVYCLLIMAASLLGGWLPSIVRFTHTRMQVMMSFVGGLMMGVALLHMLPHAAAEADSWDHAAIAAVLGLLAMFFAIRIFHVHGHESPDPEHAGHASRGAEEAPGHAHPHAHSHDCACVTDSPPHPAVSAGACQVHQLSWVGLFTGLALHTLIDGVALAASVAVGAGTAETTGLIGLGTFVAVALHKPLDALSITSIMLAGGWSARARRTVNIIFSLMCPAGAIVFFFAVGTLGHIIGWSLGFAAGAFLCISLADVLPEVQFHRHDRFKLSAALLLGVVLAWSIGFLEPEHRHDASHQSEHAAAHDHE